MASPYSIFNTFSTTDANAPAQNFLLVNGAATVNSNMWSGEDSDGYGLTVFTTGSLSGTFQLWMTDKNRPDETTDNDWIQDTTFVPVNPAGGPIKFRDDGGNAKAYRKRLKFVNTSGVGTLQAFVTVPKTRGA